MWPLITIIVTTIAVVEFGLLLSAWRKLVDQEERIRNLDAVATFYKRH